MELVNATRMVAGHTMALDKHGREHLVVVVKGTFRFPLPDEPPGHFALHDEQQPLVMADSFTGEPGLSAPVYDVDFALRKPRLAESPLRGWKWACAWARGARPSR